VLSGGGELGLLDDSVVVVELVLDGIGDALVGLDRVVEVVDLVGVLRVHSELGVGGR